MVLAHRPAGSVLNFLNTNTLTFKLKSGCNPPVLENLKSWTTQVKQVTRREGIQWLDICMQFHSNRITDNTDVCN